MNCDLYLLLQEFTLAFQTAVHILAYVDMKLAQGELYTLSTSFETKYPERLFIIARDFNRANLMSVLPKYYQHAHTP